LAGWIAALLFLLWRARRLPLAGFLAPIPFLALWSPFAVMGIVPFAAYAGIATLRRGELRVADVMLPAVTLALAVPGLLYLTAESDAVGSRPTAISVAQYVAFEAIEVAPYLLALAFLGPGRFGAATLAITAAVLLGAPLLQIGNSTDFVMRASIPALAILALLVADALADRQQALWRGLLLVALGVGLATPAFEIVRAFVYPRAPAMLCSYFGVVPGGFNTYVAPLSRIPASIAPADAARIVPRDPARCWATPWPNPLYREFPERVEPEDWDERL
jgi:hypothetical protein